MSQEERSNKASSREKGISRQGLMTQAYWGGRGGGGGEGKGDGGGEKVWLTHEIQFFI